MSKYIAIKRDSTFPITVGGNTLINLQKLLLYILADKTQEDIQVAQEKIALQQWDEDWYEHLAFLSIMIRSIEQAAHDKGLTIEEDLDQAPPTQQEN